MRCWHQLRREKGFVAAQRAATHQNLVARRDTTQARRGDDGVASQLERAVQRVARSRKHHAGMHAGVQANLEAPRQRRTPVPGLNE